MSDLLKLSKGTDKILEDEQHPGAEEYENRVIVFLDILGFKELVNKSRNDRNLVKKITQILGTSKNSSVDEFFTKFTKYIQDNTLKNAHDIDDRLTTFSDFFAMSVPLSNNQELTKNDATNIAILIYATFRQFRRLMLAGLLARGGITSGAVYHLDNTDKTSSSILFGPAFNEAYLLESQFANIPRVIISNSLRKRIKKYCDNPQNQECPFRSILNNYIKRAADGPAYIDVFADFIHKPLIEEKDIIKIKENLCLLLEEETDKPNIYYKIIAISNLFNNAIDESNKNHDLKIPKEYLPTI